MEFFRKRDLFVIFLAIIFLIAVSVFFVQGTGSTQTLVFTEIEEKSVLHTEPEPPLSPPSPTKLENPPEIVRAVYLTGWSAGSKKYLNYLSSLFENTEINAVVIDIKDYSGLVSYNSGAIADIDSLVRFLHAKNIYAIARISVFEDPILAAARPELAVYNEETKGLWQDNKGLSWMDPASKDVWDYNINLAKDVFYHGFDEVNFDYVRFPSDGNMSVAGFPVWDQNIPMAEVIKEFFQYVRAGLPNDKISVDLFGLTTVNSDDMGIGQILEHAFESFDYVCPMVYPSHYASGFIGFLNPAEHPYEVIKYSLDSAMARESALSNQLSKLRPWLQDFDMGANYTSEMVKQEIKATQDSLKENYVGYMLWSPSNIYTQEALIKNAEAQE